MKTLYIDGFSGISGDKFVGALLELSENFEFLKEQLTTLNIEDEYSISLSKRMLWGYSPIF